MYDDQINYSEGSLNYSDDAFQMVKDLDELEPDHGKVKKEYRYPFSHNIPPVKSINIIKELSSGLKFSAHLFFDSSCDILKDSQNYYVIRYLKENVPECEYDVLFKDPVEDIDKFQTYNCNKIFSAGIPPPNSGCTPWIICEYVPGSTLYQTIKYSRQLNTNDKFRILINIVLILVDFHKNGIYNRDIRLESIVITTEQMPIFTDFEFIYKYNCNNPNKEPKYQVYMDPGYELNSDENNSVKIKNDLYAVAMTICMFIRKTITPLSDEVLNNYDNILQKFHEMKNHDPERPNINQDQNIDSADVSNENETQNTNIGVKIGNEPTNNESGVIPSLVKSNNDLDQNGEIQKNPVSIVEAAYNAYFESIGLSFVSNDDIEQKILQVTRECMLGRIHNATDLHAKLIECAKNAYFNTDATTNLMPNSNSTPRGNIKEVEKSAEKFNTNDLYIRIWHQYNDNNSMTSSFNGDFRTKQDIQLLPMASLYAAITNDFKYFEDIMKKSYLE